MQKIRLPTEREFWTFALQIPIATKDYGVKPIQPWGTQAYLLKQILAAKEEGINQIIVVKLRQGGVSTFMQLLTLLWLKRYPGLQGLTVTDSPDNKEYFRDLFLGMIHELELRGDKEITVSESADPSKLRARNQVQFAWENQSRLLLQVCGRQTWSRLGVGRGLSFTHGTEPGLWPNGGKALTFLRAAWSEINPASLYVIEGTARGKNWYFDLAKTAMKAKTMRFVFLGWWMREDNRIPRNHKKIWSAYGNPQLTPKEKKWDVAVRKRYKTQIAMEQWVWRRWYHVEKAGNNEKLADQEMPTIWEDAFEASQENAFLDDQTQARVSESTMVPAANYIYEWGSTMEQTRPESAGDRTPMLRVWSPPDSRPTVVAAVPGNSSMPEDPSWVISIWAASLDEDKLEQVAEFHTEANIGLSPFAWTALHLAGAYGVRHKTFVLEVAGLGMGVLSEIRRIVNLGYGTNRQPGFLDVLGGIRHYVWRRPDSMRTQGAWQWKSNADNQATVLQRFRDQIKRGAVLVRSQALADELERLEGSGDGYAPVGDKPRGHRAMAGALAVESYIAQLAPTLQKYRQRGPRPTSVTGRMVHDFYSTLGRG